VLHIATNACIGMFLATLKFLIEFFHFEDSMFVILSYIMQCCVAMLMFVATQKAILLFLWIRSIFTQAIELAFWADEGKLRGYEAISLNQGVCILVSMCISY
jgi:endonuclease/exonuclease/phosphatase (EEP) superfamily protein YafD